MEPSRKLDMLVAKALGWRQLSYRLWHDGDGRERWIDDRENAWSPSTDITLALGLSDNMTIHKSDGRYQCIIDPEYGYCMELLGSRGQAEANTLPLAICRALIAGGKCVERAISE